MEIDFIFRIAAIGIIVSVLMGGAVEPRKNYITEHARRVRNLDI